MKRAAFHPCHVHNWTKRGYQDIFTCALELRRYQVAKSPCVAAVNDLCSLCYQRLTYQNQRSTKCTAYREPAGKELWPKWWTFCFNFNRFQYSFQQISIYFQSWFTFIFHVFPNRSRFLGWTHVCPARAVKSVAAGLSQLKRWRKKHQQRWDGLVFHKYLLTCYEWQSNFSYPLPKKR